MSRKPGPAKKDKKYRGCRARSDGKLPGKDPITYSWIKKVISVCGNDKQFWCGIVTLLVSGHY